MPNSLAGSTQLPMDSCKIESNLVKIIDGAICAANNAAESGDADCLKVDRELDPILGMLRDDDTGTIAGLLISRIDEMQLGVQLSLMRDAVECANPSSVALVANLLGRSMLALDWNGGGWLEKVSPPATEPLKAAHCAMVNTLMIIDADWGGNEIIALRPVLTAGEPMARRAAWVAIRCWAWTSRALPPTMAEAIRAGLSDADPVIRSHAEQLAT